jgi:CheY-like chemotaxis protein
MSSSSAKTKRKILVVDDEPDTTFTLKYGLENSGLFEVETYNDPIEALSNFQAGLLRFFAN